MLQFLSVGTAAASEEYSALPNYIPIPMTLGFESTWKVGAMTSYVRWCIGAALNR